MSSDAVAWHTDNARAFDERYARSAAFRERLEIWTALIERFTRADSRVLDAGCGSGVFSLVAARRAAFVLGIDASPAMIDLAEEKKRAAGADNLSLRCMPLDALDGLGEQPPFDVILCSSVLEYVPDYWQTLDALAARLAEGGILVFSMPNGRSLYRAAERLAFRATGRPEYYAHVRHVPTAAAVRRGLTARGFEVEELRYFAAAPFLSTPARHVGRPDLADNLFVVACHRRRNRLGTSSNVEADQSGTKT